MFAVLLLSLSAIKLLHNKKNMTDQKSLTPLIPTVEFTHPISLDGNKLKAMVADTNELREQGLSGQKSLTDNEAMLFDFKNSGRKKPGFWMKDMLFAIDIIWLRNNSVVDISKNVPPPVVADAKNLAGGELPLYFPAEPIDAVLEVRAGWSDQHNIELGSRLEIF